MKLNNLHMIIILVCAVLFSTIVGPDIKEGMTEGQYIQEKSLGTVESANTGTKQDRNYIKNNAHTNNQKSKHKKHKKRRHRQNKLYSSDQLNMPPGYDAYKRGVIRDYANNNYNAPLTYSDSEYDSDGQNNGYGYVSSDSDSDDDYNQGNTQYPQNAVPGTFNPQLGMPTQPRGIDASEIPYGDEDKYILKSEIVPPVCPACPTVTNCPDTKKPRPCPPCARCPEPAFECKKVPNYTKTNTMLPVPILNDFSQF